MKKPIIVTKWHVFLRCGLDFWLDEHDGNRLRNDRKDVSMVGFRDLEGRGIRFRPAAIDAMVEVTEPQIDVRMATTTEVEDGWERFTDPDGLVWEKR